MSAPAISVPQANPGAGYRALQGEIDAAVARVLQSGWYILGQEVRAFEAEFAAWLGATAAVGCGNGTDALALALRALGVGPGTSVVTVSHTAVATVAAIEMVGATPVLIDIEPDYYTMDPGELAEVLAHPPAGTAADPCGDPGASLRPAGGAGTDRRGVPPARRRGDRGLRAGARRHHRRPQGGHVHRGGHVQLLSDQEPRRAGRRRHAGDAERGPGRRHRRAAPVRLAARTTSAMRSA